MGRGYLSPQLNDGLHQLTSVQMLGKIFIGSVYILASAKLNTRGGGYFWESFPINQPNPARVKAKTQLTIGGNVLSREAFKTIEINAPMKIPIPA